jgi:thioredoxin:protein disulfide reductase
MKPSILAKPTTALLFLTAFAVAPSSFHSYPLPQSAPKIDVSASLSTARTQRRRTVLGSVILEIPSGYHINSSRPLEKFLIPTRVTVEAPKGIRLGPVSYPRAILRRFKFSKNRVSVYEGRATMRFNVSIPTNFAKGSVELKPRVRYQSCNDEVCFPPQTRELSIWLNVE